MMCIKAAPALRGHIPSDKANSVQHLDGDRPRFLTLSACREAGRKLERRLHCLIVGCTYLMLALIIMLAVQTRRS